MTIVFVVLGIVLLAAIGMVAAGRFGQLDSPIRDRRPAPILPVDPSPSAVRAVRFSLAPRGYRMGEVDSALRTLAATLADRDAQISELRASQQEVGDTEALTQPRPPVTAGKESDE